MSSLVEKLLEKFAEDSEKMVITWDDKKALENFLHENQILAHVVESRTIRMSHYNIHLHNSHIPGGQPHIHFSSKKMGSGSFNKDFSSHDGWNGRIPNQIADISRKLGFKVPKNQVVEGLVNEAIPLWAAVINLSDFKP